jgi:hypothetical protein
MADKISYLPGHGQGTSGPGGGDMDGDRLTRLEVKVETILPTLATKADISDAKYDIVKWLSAIILAVAAIGISVLLFALNRIAPSQATTQAAPIVIYPQPSLPASQSPPAPRRDR